MPNLGRRPQAQWTSALLLIVALHYPPLVIAQDAPPEMKPASEETLGLLAKFYGYDGSIPLEVRIVEKKKTDGGIREKIVLRGVHGYLAPGYLEYPVAGTAPYPCVLLLHGWSGSKASWWNDGTSGSLRTALLEAGYAVFALDAPTHGDRIAENDYAGVNDFQGPRNDGRKNYFTVPEIIIQSCIDYRRAIDYLETREEIVAERVGLLGYSMGGLQSVVLTAVEPRIRVAVGCVVPKATHRFEHIAPYHYARGIGERPYLMLMGRGDPMCSLEHAQLIFDLVPSSRKQLNFYDGGHNLPKEYVPDAVAWFAKYL